MVRAAHPHSLGLACPHRIDCFSALRAGGIQRSVLFSKELTLKYSFSATSAVAEFIHRSDRTSFRFCRCRGVASGGFSPDVLVQLVIEIQLARRVPQVQARVVRIDDLSRARKC
jgi:hypothetical protein